MASLQDLLRFHIRRLQHFCERHNYPINVILTSVTLFTRFYVDHSPLDFPPASIVLSSIYAACKIEEHYTLADELANNMNHMMRDLQDVVELIPAGTVLGTELSFLESLDFCLICYHPIKSITLLLDNLNNKEEMEKWKQRAEYITKRWVYTTDVHMCNAPGVIAIAIVVIVAEENDMSEKDVRMWTNMNDNEWRYVQEIVMQIKKSGQQSQLDMNQLRHIEKERRQVDMVDNFYSRCIKLVDSDDEHFVDESSRGEKRKSVVVSSKLDGIECSLKRAKPTHT